MKTILIIISISFLASCASDTQQKGLDNIAKHYDATTAFSKGFNTKNNKTTRYFQIIISNSKMLDSLRPDVTLSHIAMMLLSDLTEEEQDNYNFIKVAYINNSQDTIKYRYPIQVLKQGIDQVALFTEFSDKVVAEKYTDAVSMLDPLLLEKNTAIQFENYIKNLTAKHGKVIGYKRLGFGALSENGVDLFQFNGYLSFADYYKKPYIITMTKDVANDYIMGYNFNVSKN